MATTRRNGLGRLPKDDEPIQFVAACVELVQAWDNPKFVTRLPLTFDASCSGLQHLCAMTRDEEGGRYVNLIPSEETDDFNVAYQVCRRFLSACRLSSLARTIQSFNFHGGARSTARS